MKARMVLLLPLAFATGCVITTTQPLSDPLTAEADESLYGHWIASERQSDGTTHETHLFIGKHTVDGEPESIMEYAGVGWNRDKLQAMGGGRNVYFTVARICKYSYMNLFQIEGERDTPDLSAQGSYRRWASNEKRRCWVFRYQCDGRQLTVWTVKDAAKTMKRLADERQLDVTDNVVTIESLVRYLRKNGGSTLFSEQMFVFHKSP
jgi:hypothetical protein